jgi:hypothetical protein
MPGVMGKYSGGANTAWMVTADWLVGGKSEMLRFSRGKVSVSGR